MVIVVPGDGNSWPCRRSGLYLLSCFATGVSRVSATFTFSALLNFRASRLCMVSNYTQRFCTHLGRDKTSSKHIHRGNRLKYLICNISRTSIKKKKTRKTRLIKSIFATSVWLLFVASKVRCTVGIVPLNWCIHVWNMLEQIEINTCRNLGTVLHQYIKSLMPKLAAITCQNHIILKRFIGKWNKLLENRY